ncbi:hypothetical protein V494_00801 [Pseudogymnoascus sp. VKM F-4513 (FW-928)]|nr:hypothetical protein V494_00801 [Pseudogymnoascus sp. VKM F-4513 (FW-928)]
MKRLLGRFKRQTLTDDDTTLSQRHSTVAVPTVPDKGGINGLCEAITRGNLPVVQQFLDAGTPINAKDARGFTPLHRAIQHGFQEIAGLLLSQGADITATTSSGGITTIHLAVAVHDVEMMRLLLDHGAWIETPMGRANATPLFLAIRTGPKEMVKLLLERGANPHARDELLPVLLAGGADVNASGSIPGQTPLHVAAELGYEDLARSLYGGGANISARDEEGRTPLHVAAEHGQLDVIEFLHEKGAQVMDLTEQGETALCVAASHGKKEAVSVLLGLSSEILTDVQKATVMISAARSGSLEVVEFLVRQGFSANAFDSSQVSALETAALRNHESVVIFLLRNGAGLNLPAKSTTLKICNERIRRLLSGKELPIPTQQDMMGNSSLDNAPTGRVSRGTLYESSADDISEKRVMAFASPAGRQPDCSVCRDLDFRRGHGSKVEVMFKVNRNDLASAAKNGCTGCSVIYSPVRWPVIGPAREVSVEPWSDQRRSLVRDFAEDCLANHAKCSYSEGLLPTKVIDVGSTSQDPFLYITNGENGQYVTLSHCWGGSSPITTTTKTIGARMSGFSIDTVPKTFREAILVTRELGVRYLWIDSLCIIQDSHEDWEHEVARMGEVYANGQKGEVCHKLNDSESAIGLKRFKPNALDTRGWNLQERLLAPRILHLGISEIGWECAGKRACECQLVTTPIDQFVSFNINLLNPQQQPRSARQTRTSTIARDIENRWIWSGIIEEFTRRNLTLSKDALPALSGLAKRMCSGAEHKYVCGMWKENLAGFLMWQPDYNHISQNSVSGVPKRHGKYYAPSWSWASVIGPVVYKELEERSCLEGNGRSYGKYGGEYNWGHENMKIILSILSVQCEQQGLKPFGPPKSAYLHVRGHTASATLHSKTKKLPAQSSGNGGLLLGTDKPSAAEADFEPDVKDAYAEVSIGDKVCLLFTIESPHAGDDVRRYTWGRGLVLRTVAVGGPYIRVGTFRFQGAESWKKWREIREVNTLRLI